MKVCKNCGTQNKDTSLFCEGCGTRLEEVAAEQTPVTDTVAEAAPETEASAPEPAVQEPQVQPAFSGQPVETQIPETTYSGQTAQPQQNTYQQAVPPQQNTYQQPVQPTYSAVPQEPEKKSGNWMTITSLILSILSIVCCCLDVFALLLAIASIILAIIALVQHKGSKGMAIASLIIGAIGFLLAVYLLVYAFVILPNNPAVQSQIMELYDELGITGFIR